MESPKKAKVEDESEVSLMSAEANGAPANTYTDPTNDFHLQDLGQHARALGILPTLMDAEAIDTRLAGTDGDASRTDAVPPGSQAPSAGASEADARPTLRRALLQVSESGKSTTSESNQSSPATDVEQTPPSAETATPIDPALTALDPALQDAGFMMPDSVAPRSVVSLHSGIDGSDLKSAMMADVFSEGRTRGSA